MAENEEQTLVWLGNILKSALYRSQCPDTMTRVNWDMGFVDDEQTIQVHVAQCTHCQAELVRLAEFMDGIG